MEHSTVKEKVMKDNISLHVLEDKCCGCGACFQICPLEAIKMKEDEHGFRMPIVDSALCVGCGLCMKSCPIIHSEEERHSPIKSYAATNLLSEKSFLCSSGGIFSALAEYVINNGGVVCGAAFDNELKLQHVMVDNLEDLEKLKKSKYLQSNTDKIYKKVKKSLSEGKTVLFSGTPCQVKALYTFLGESKTDRLLTIDVVCHGVPSQMLFDDYIDDFQRKNGKIENSTFRAKRKAKNGMKWFFSFTIKEKNHFRNWPEDSYNYYYMMGKIYRDSCYSCPFASINRVSDITLCDYWSWEKYHGNDFDLMECVSGILINTSAGALIFENIRDSIVCVHTKLEDIVRHNGCLDMPTNKPADRDRILSDWKEKGYCYIDALFRKTHRIQRVKYALLRMLPDGFLERLLRLK